MKRETGFILERLRAVHVEPRCELVFSNPLELIVATVLSAQCTDERVNKVTASLFKKYRSIDDYLSVSPEELEEDVRPTGFYRNKAKSIQGISREIRDRFGGAIPDDIDTFATIKGIGRKSANMIVGLAFGRPAVIVDTHMIRVAGRIGLTKETDPVRIEGDLRNLVPEPVQTDFSLLVILHGRYVCTAKKPDCGACTIREVCDFGLKGGAS